MASNELQILNLLKSRGVPISALEISRTIKVERSVVNRILYGNKNCIKIDGTPPLWTCDVEQGVAPSNAKDDIEPLTTIIIIDLGNVHDCLKQLVGYASSDSPQVYAFADIAFNGYGVNPPAPFPIVVSRATSRHSNAADIDIMWHIATMVLRNHADKMYRFIIATKDQQFQSISDKITENGHEVIFVTDWNGLKIYVE